MQENEPNSLSLVTDLHVAATAKLVEALVQSENRMRLRLDLLSEVVFEIDAERRITFLNKAWLAVGGRKIESLRGKPILDLFHPEDGPLLAELLDDLTHAPTDRTVTCRILRPDGRETWVECGAVVVPGAGWVGTMRDVTRSKQALEQLQLLSLVANHTDNFVIITDARGLIRWVNRSFMEFTGYTMAEVAGRTPGSLLQGPGTDPQEVRRLGEHIRAERSVTSEILNYTKSGEPYWVTLHLTPIRDEDGVLESYISVQSNTTAMHALNAQLAEEKFRAESASEAKSQFLSNVSHEIRTPLNAVLGFLNLLGRTGLDAHQSGYVDKMGTASRHLLRLINDILDFSKVEARMMELDIHPFTLAAVVQEVSDIVTADCRAKGLSVSVEVGAAAGRRVLGDSHKLRQVLLNLTSNAVKFTERGGVRLVLRELAEAEGSLMVEFRVEDSGIGMEARQIETIFDEFSQAEASTTRRFGGTGLGLAISQRLVDLMGGQIAVESQPGQGSRFFFTLSFRIAGDEGAVALPPTPAPRLSRPLAGLRILVVEDNEINQLVARDILTAEGAEILLAENGAVAVDLFADPAFAPDIVLMDIQMPVMDGFEAARRILSRRPDVPILAMTANTAATDRAETAAAGMRAHIGKPFDPDLLADAILRHARRGERAVGGASAALARLRHLLAEADMDAIAEFDALRGADGLASAAWMGDVARALEQLDFEAALTALPDQTEDIP